jgi:hypothetical protein
MVIESLVLKLRYSLNTWCLDHGTLAGPEAVVLSDIVEVISFGEELGLQLIPKKCELMVLGWGNSQAPFIEEISELLPGIKVIRRSQCEFLGAPLASEALPRVFTNKIETIGLLVERLPPLQSHTALFLLKNCLATPKLVYLLRCSPTFQEPGLFIELDSIIRNSEWTRNAAQIDEQAQVQASIPVSRGGLD